MPDSMNSTATTEDVTVLPQQNVSYQPLPPSGVQHRHYVVVATEPTPRRTDDR